MHRIRKTTEDTESTERGEKLTLAKSAEKREESGRSPESFQRLLSFVPIRAIRNRQQAKIDPRAC